MGFARGILVREERCAHEPDALAKEIAGTLA
jgi:hypothetical protein